MKPSELKQLIREELDSIFNETTEVEQLDEAMFNKVLEKLGISDKLAQIKSAVNSKMQDFENTVIDGFEKLKADPSKKSVVDAIEKLALQFKGTDVNTAIDKVLTWVSPEKIQEPALTEGKFSFKNVAGVALKALSIGGGMLAPALMASAFLYNPLYQILMPILGASGIAAVGVGIVSVAIVLNVLGKYLAGDLTK